MGGGPGIGRVQADRQGYLARVGLDAQHMLNATHLIWATGGNRVPADEMDAYISKGRALLAQG